MNKTELIFIASILVLAIVIALMVSIVGYSISTRNAIMEDVIPEGEPLHPEGYTFPNEALEEDTFEDYGEGKT